MEHFSKQVIDSRQVFIGFPQGKPNMFSLVSVGFEKCLPEFLVERVSYPETGRSNSEIEFTTIEFIISGNGELCLGGSNFNLEPGSLFSYKTGEYHKISSSQNKPMVKYFMVLAHSPEIIIKSKIINKQLHFQGIRDHGEIIELFELILSNANTSSVEGISICNLLAQTVVLKTNEQKNNGSNKYS